MRTDRRELIAFLRDVTRQAVTEALANEAIHAALYPEYSKLFSDGPTKSEDRNMISALYPHVVSSRHRAKRFWDEATAFNAAANMLEAMNNPEAASELGTDVYWYSMCQQELRRTAALREYNAELETENEKLRIILSNNDLSLD